MLLIKINIYKRSIFFVRREREKKIQYYDIIDKRLRYKIDKRFYIILRCKTKKIYI